MVEQDGHGQSARQGKGRQIGDTLVVRRSIGSFAHQALHGLLCIAKKPSSYIKCKYEIPQKKLTIDKK